MKKKLVAAAWLISTLAIAQTSDPVIMTVAGKPISKSVFEYTFNKNKQQQLEVKTLDQYVELFKNFRLKVAAAEAAGIDTTQAFIKELASYRSQLAQPYLVDREVDESLAQEAYGRMQTNVEVAHILVKLPQSPTEADKAAALKRIKEIEARLKKGEDFNTLARELSDDQSAKQNNGNLGYISGFMTVLPFEEVAYNTPVGSVSAPFISTFGYHLLKVKGTRPDRGEILTAHIMCVVSSDATPEAKAQAQQRINELYAQLEGGADFGQLAKEKSDDTHTGARGGELPWFNSGRMVPEFENVAYALKNKGDYSKPVLTPYGWHIIKLIDTKPLFTYEKMRADLIRRMARDERGSRSKHAQAEKLKKEYKFSTNSASLARLTQLAGKDFPADSAYLVQINSDKTELFRFDGGAKSLADFATYLATNRNFSNERDPRAYLAKALREFEAQTILAYEDTRLEEKYPEFRNLMSEYHDGILLFEISNREVWSKASKDTKALADYFAANKAKYTFAAPRYKGYFVECTDPKVAARVKKAIKTYPADSVVAKVRAEFNDTITCVKITKGLFKAGDNPGVDQYVFKGAKMVVDPQFPISFVSGKLLKKKPQEYTDVRGQVTADYQSLLEQQWIEELRANYPIEINQEVLKTVNSR